MSPVDRVPRLEASPASVPRIWKGTIFLVDPPEEGAIVSPNLESVPLVDPRGAAPQNGETISLAPRPTPDELTDASVLYFDNSKLNFANYMAVFDTIESAFAQRGITDITFVQELLRGTDSGDLATMAREFSEAGYDVAITSLGDMGMTVATSVLTAELEQVGIPSVEITSPPGSMLARAVVEMRDLPIHLCEIDIYQGSSEMAVKTATEGIIDDLLTALTSDEPPVRGDRTIDSGPPIADDGRILLPSKSVEDGPIDPGLFLDDLEAEFAARHLNDGFPVIPPTSARVQRMLEESPVAGDYVFAKAVGPAGVDMTGRDVAIAAVMAGCSPAYMPILVTAVEAITDKDYNVLQSVTTSFPGGNLLVASGPKAADIGMAGQYGCLGPGYRANATIGRAVTLLHINRCRAIPGRADLSCLGSPAEYTYCFMEDATITEWSTLNEDYADATSTVVYAMKAEGPTNVVDLLSTEPAPLVESFIDASSNLGSNNAYCPGPLVIVLAPNHYRIFNEHGWTKTDIKRDLHERATWETAKLEGRGISPVRPPAFDDRDPVPITRSIDDIEVMVAGGAGGHSAVIRPWSMESEAVVQVVPAGE